MLKKITSTLLIAGILLAPVPAFAQETTSSLPYISLQEQVLDLPPYQSSDGVLMLPVRALGEALGFDVLWAAETNSVTMSQGQNYYTIYLGKDFYVKNSKSLKLGAPAATIKGNLYAPVAFFNEIMDLSATIDELGNVSILDDIPTLTPDTTSNLMLGDYFNITLETNSSTGYSWLYTLEKPLVKLIATTSTPENTAIGSPSTVHYIFKTQSLGQQDLHFSYARPWESKMPSQEANFSVLIGPVVTPVSK